MTDARFHFAGLFAALLLVGCNAPHDAALEAFVSRGDLGRARMHVYNNLTTDRGDRRYLLDRVNLGVLTLADGYPHAAEQVFQDVYDVLRTQGINADKTVSSVVINEGVKFWKGEPFEQAMALTYIALTYGQLGDWGNTRAASESALFQLRDFGKLTAEDLATRDAPVEQGYTTARSDFTLAYLMSAVASRQLGRTDEANARFADALAVDPTLQPLVAKLRDGDYNALFVVDFGMGPRKIATGPDGAIAKFVPRTGSDNRQLVARVGDRDVRMPPAIDLNRIATRLMWNSLEDVRLAKSTIGSAMIAAGALTAAAGDQHNHDETVLAGLAILGAGLLAKAGAHADTRYCQTLPQRVYMVPLRIDSPAQRVTLSLEGHVPMTFTGIAPPARGSPALLRYVRLPTQGDIQTAGDVLYANRHAPDAGERHYPYILGGHDVRAPTIDVLSDIQRRGYLAGYTLGQFQDLYLAEGIEPTPDDNALPLLHVLEGGPSLACPLPGTAGYARLFTQPHGMYQPRSDKVRQAAARVQSNKPERNLP